MSKEPTKEQMLMAIDGLIKGEIVAVQVIDAIRYLIKSQADEDCLCCPRCCKIFHDDDIAKNPEKYWTCPLCSTIQHKECRHPLDDDIEIRHLIEQNQPEITMIEIHALVNEILSLQVGGIRRDVICAFVVKKFLEKGVRIKED